ncbi:serine/threonine-protein kinase H1 [Esox lucius]|uniref:serine/threonine-protein kinase H1 n=1 Tax=Esox lucius TaxID=8010 RepID=UPI001476B5C3|nr:serine/threonine-protein kinase H1 [Esox lucius]
MGCGTSKVLPEPSKNSYVSFVKSFVSYSHRRKNFDNEPQRCKGKQKDLWSIGVTQLQPHIQQTTAKDVQHGDSKVARYRAKFDPRVTARYDIKALIGRGSYSRVVRVEHRATRQPFAIKMMEVEAKEGREVCESELGVLRRVSHPNVVQLVEVFQSTRRIYMVLELATGGELFDRVIAKGQFTERDAARALQMALAGVVYLHSLGITHRDLKPENLLYYHPGADSRLLVTDFGLASFGNKYPGWDESGGWSMMTTCGTAEYMAPEVVLRIPYTCQVDMWALGVISYILLSGSMPFEDDSRPRLYRAILRGRYSFHGVPWPSVSNHAKDFIECLLVVDPSSRLTATQALHHPWVVTMVASLSSMTNLHRSISQNLRRRASRTSASSSCCPSSTGCKSSRCRSRNQDSTNSETPLPMPNAH